MKLRSRAGRLGRACQPKMLRRWAVERCEHCGQRRRLIESWHSYGNRDGKVWHGPCIAYEQWRRHATERLNVLDLICDTWGVTQRDVEGLVSMRTADDASGSADRNQAWRVMHSLDELRGARAGEGQE